MTANEEGAKRLGVQVMELIAKVEKALAEQAAAVAALKFWGELMLQGVDSSQVEHLGYNSSLDDRRPPKRRFGPLADPYGDLAWRAEHPCYNYVRLKDGTTREIAPITKPEGWKEQA